jgi:uncharacterized membrane protein
MAGHATVSKGARMGADKRTAKIVGSLLIVATVASILGSAALGSVLDGRTYLTTIGAHDDGVRVSALLFLVAAVSAFATAFLLFPILKRHAEGWAAGYVGLRAFENVLYVVSVVALLVMLTVSKSHEAGTVRASDLSLLGRALLAVHDWSSLLGTLFFAGLGATILNYVLYRSRIVPRWLSVWGLIGGALLVLYGLLGVFGLDVGLTSPSTLLAMPLAVEEMVFAGWLLAKGFEPRDVSVDHAAELRVDALI